MKSKNFPKRKLEKQLKAAGKDPSDPKYASILQAARERRTKKNRG